MGSQGYYLYAIQGESEGLADTPWPKFRNNSRNIGNYEDAFWKKEQTIKPDGYNVYLNKTFIFFINFILDFKNEADKYRIRKN